jgi:hypothetical protein
MSVEFGLELGPVYSSRPVRTNQVLRCTKDEMLAPWKRRAMMLEHEHWCNKVVFSSY